MPITTKDGLTTIACDHPQHSPSNDFTVVSFDVEHAFRRAKELGWHISALRKWANCPYCIALHGRNSGQRRPSGPTGGRS